jgi:hypothetical protein
MYVEIVFNGLASESFKNAHGAQLNGLFAPLLLPPLTLPSFTL